MPKRSLSVHGLSFRRKGGRRPNASEPIGHTRLDGETLVNLLRAWSNGNRNRENLRDDPVNCVVIRTVRQIDNERLLLSAYAGKRGERGALYTLGNDAPTHQIDENEAATAMVRVYLYAPANRATALLFSEHCQRGNAGTHILKSFKQHFRETKRDILFSSERLVESGDWLETIESVKKIEVRIHQLPDNVSNAINSTEGMLSLSVSPRKGQSFPTRILNLFRETTQAPAGVIGFTDNLPQEQKTYAKVKGSDGREKTIDLANDDDLPFFYRTLSENGEPAVSDDEFIRICDGYAEELLAQLEG